MEKTVHLVCAECGAVNRLPAARLDHHPTCGKCGAALVSTVPVAFDEAMLARHVARSDVPLLVDFWASWCGPCRMMEPAFKAAAAELAPHVKLAKLDTEAHPGPAAQYGIRGIPTMILFAGGGEAARVSGAMDARSIVAWVRQNVGRRAA